ncbi:tyrosine-type recombinase/integrase, partial [Desulfobacterota bacterium AH_259_B03_O07]|nr:tyrosine-type recombinase/integrase [Desulfobacterota bacterium AH_259_B03_O07]
PETVEYLETEELEALYSVLEITKIMDLRLRALIELMINTGLRPSEALKLAKQDLLAEPEELGIIGKGGKKRTIYFNDRVYFWIKLYLKRRKDNHPALFVTHWKGHPIRSLTLRNAEEIFYESVKKCGFNKRVVLHTLRHTYATHLMANGCP